DAQRVGVVIDDDSAGAELHLGAVHTGHAVEFCLDLVDAARARELIGAQDDVPQVCVGHCGSPSPSWMVCCPVRGAVQGACLPGCFLAVAAVSLLRFSSYGALTQSSLMQIKLSGIGTRPGQTRACGLGSGACPHTALNRTYARPSCGIA